MKEKLTETYEDYLEQIYCFEINGTKEIRSQMLAKCFDVSKAAVAKVTNKLVDDGYIEKESYGTINLTSKGRDTAKIVLDKHQSIRTFLRLIGVSPENAEIDCCKIEHVICDETLEKIKDFINSKE